MAIAPKCMSSVKLSGSGIACRSEPKARFAVATITKVRPMVIRIWPSSPVE